MLCTMKRLVKTLSALKAKRETWFICSASLSLLISVLFLSIDFTAERHVKEFYKDTLINLPSPEQLKAEEAFLVFDDPFFDTCYQSLINQNPQYRVVTNPALLKESVSISTVSYYGQAFSIRVKSSASASFVKDSSIIITNFGVSKLQETFPSLKIVFSAFFLDSQIYRVEKSSAWSYLSVSFGIASIALFFVAAIIKEKARDIRWSLKI